LILTAGEVFIRLNNDLPKIVEKLPVGKLNFILGENYERFLKILEYQLKLTFLL
jgi:hypothetical protein